jgi:glycosyltransferase involved in cell wall biosynthesis
MTITICITTYGDDGWQELAWSRAYPSTIDQGADEVIVRHHADLSIGPARNKTASEATGDFLIHLDADDELETDYVNSMRVAANVASPQTLFQPAVRYIRKGQMANPILIPQKDLRHDNYLVVGTMIARDLFERVGGFEDLPHGFEDFSLWAKSWKSGATVTQVPHAIYNAHINPKSKHRTMWRRRKEQVYWHQRTQHLIFPEEYPMPAQIPEVS